MEPIVSPAGQGRSVGVLGDRYTFTVTGDDTNGRFALSEVTVFPGHATPPHVHRREEETFYILQGVLTFIINGREHQARSGDTVFAPRDVPHYFHNRSDQQARFLCLFTPAGFEGFFFEIGEPLPDPAAIPAAPTAEYIQRVLETAPRYGVEILTGSA